jgi:hypothetical protein
MAEGKIERTRIGPAQRFQSRLDAPVDPGLARARQPGSPCELVK